MTTPHRPIDRLLIAAQLPLTCAILAMVPTNPGKLLALCVVWVLTFRRATRAEWVMIALVSAFFTLMNAAALSQGIFAFARPDILGMPVYELVMWGFYVLHTRRLVAEAPIAAPNRRIWILALSYAACFATLKSPSALLIVTASLLVLGLWWHHDRADVAYVVYMVLLGAAIEYTGVLSGEWSYPSPPPGGVPPWFITMWGGVGYFLHRLVLPMVRRSEGRSAPPLPTR